MNGRKEAWQWLEAAYDLEPESELVMSGYKMW